MTPNPPSAEPEAAQGAPSSGPPSLGRPEEARVPNADADVAEPHPRNISALLSHAAALLARAGVPDPEVDAELLIGHVLGLGRGQVQSKALIGASVHLDEYLAIAEVVERRARREPLQHITGLAPFRMMELEVGPGVFVPRPETEVVAQFAIDSLAAAAGPTPIAVDLGTGSGAIALALATEVPHARVVAVENSPQAFVWAKQNHRRIGAENLRLVFADLAVVAEVLPELLGAVSVLISNPPYIPQDAVPRDPEVRLYDPPAALYGGEDGLDAVRALSQTALLLLHRGGTLVIEHGEPQGAEIRALLEADGWSATATHQDLTRRDRYTTALR